MRTEVAIAPRRRNRGADLVLATALGALTLGVGGAYAQSGGVGTAPPPSAGSGSNGSGNEASQGPDTTPDPGGKVELLVSNARPRKAYELGSPAVFRYEIAGTQARDLTIEVVRKSSREVITSVEQRDVDPKQQQQVSWAGQTDAGGIADEGEYRFRVVSSGGEPAETKRAEGKPDAGFYKHKFPVRGRHSYGDGVGAGRGHKGQDVMADCGTPLVAAHAGTVQATGYDSYGGGNYVVIDGRHDKFDYVYMHLRERARVAEGDRVKTGQRLGEVGDTGNATACHLHFELWSAGGWYEGGHFLASVTRNLKRWDHWS